MWLYFLKVNWVLLCISAAFFVVETLSIKFWLPDPTKQARKRSKEQVASGEVERERKKDRLTASRETILSKKCIYDYSWLNSLSTVYQARFSHLAQGQHKEANFYTLHTVNFGSEMV